MQKVILFVAAAILSGWSTVSQAQTQTGRLRGTVMDEGQKTLPSATLALLQSKDSLVVKLSVADKSGHYEFENLPAGRYLVKASAAGHATAFSETVELKEEKAEISLKTIALTPLVKGLAGVTVTATKPFIEQKADKTVVNVEAALTNAGSTALEVLEKSPGVTVDKDGNISLKGKQGVMVMIDGRPAYLSGAELTNYLKNLPASAIEQIEIMTNPSARYDAAGNSGIINIRSKKNKQKGFNGSLSVTYGQGKLWSNHNSGNLNYRNGKVNLFANVNSGFWNNFQTLEIHRKFKNASGETTAIFDQVANMRSDGRYNNLKLGADYFIDKKTTLGIVTYGQLNNGGFGSRNTSYLQNADKRVDSMVYATSRHAVNQKNGSINLNLRRQFDTSGRELTTDVDYITYQSSSEQLFTNNTYDTYGIKSGQEDTRGDLPVKVDIYSAKADYTHPLNKETKLEAGLKTSFVKTGNDANYYRVAGSEEWPDYSKTNHFLYRENINAAYINMNRQFKKFGVQTGMRYENTSYSGKQYGNPEHKDSSFRKTYNNLFPTVFVSYNGVKDNQFGLSYGRRIDRPSYQDLNPFIFFLDNYTYQMGNPFLKPQYTHNIELNHTFKGFLTTTLNYNNTKDLNMELFEQGRNLNGSGEYATVVKRGNIGKRQSAGVSVSAQVPVKKWWSANIYSNYNRSSFQGHLESGYAINATASNLMFNIGNQFKWEKGWSAELSGFYRTKGIEGQIRTSPMGQVSIGVGKQVLNGKGTVKLNVRDLFYSMYPKGDIKLQNTEARFANRWDSRAVNLTFSYRFGKAVQGQQQRRKTGGADDEQNRIKTGS